MKLFPFTRVTQVLPADQRTAGGAAASPQSGEAQSKTAEANEVVRSLRSGDDRRQGGDRRRNDRAPSSVAVMFDTRAKTARRRAARRSEDDEQLRHFSIKI
ncbi:hypothetical protein LPB67_11395 [Undibacterium sp. Jales W-56]|uniref:hypothetical protein n=1 Tax=Undibacterium sp. Jales W-56 TaxID=2897325 RepID=UPI0021D01AAB|nr:hypothetical protein [Undibacterium sp. Jales W-56]MCU6434377.1 hypothetical protein [Undibacterium sp. Jales W-56]